jgi:hypothetical protein
MTHLQSIFKAFMSFRHLGRMTTLVAAVVTAACSESNSVTAPEQLDLKPRAVNATYSDRAWWYNLSQTSRVNYILNRAKADNGKYVGVECKPWVQRVFPSASRNVVDVPPTYPNASGYSWYSSPYFVKAGSITSVLPGDVVQMRWNGGPHTFIVVSRQSTGLTVIDSNFSSKTKPNYVQIHSITFKEFAAKTGGYYTVYRVTSGPKTYLV